MLLRIIILLALFKWTAGTAKVKSIQPRVGGAGGAVRVTVYGSGFTESEPNYAGGTNPKEVKVFFVNSFYEFECDVGTDGSTNESIVCYTRPMPYDNYYVKLVSGDEVAYDDNCYGNPRRHSCLHATRWWRTPDVRWINVHEEIESPISRAYFPGQLVQVRSSRIYTDTYGSNNQTSSTGIDTSFRRIYVGGHSCELINSETSSFYQLQIDYSDIGTFSCKTQGTHIGFSNLTYILTNVYGRSKTVNSVYVVNGDDEVHMLSSYAVIDRISPASGSVEGGTVLTVRGEHFDTDVTVLVGGVKCDVIKSSVTHSSLQCITRKKREDWPEMFAGSRGVSMEWWNETRILPHEVWSSLNGSEQDYRGRHTLQQAAYIWNVEDEFVATLHGIFVAPQSDQYKFHLKCDDTCEVNITCTGNNETIRLFSPAYSPHYYRYPSLVSDWRFLEKDQQCIFQSAVMDWTDVGNIYMAVLRQRTTITNSQAGQALNDKQRLDFSSNNFDEIQKISFNNWQSGTGVEEKQVVRIKCASCSSSEFRLMLCGMSTPYLNFKASSSDVLNALKEVVKVCGETDLLVKRTSITDGFEYEITFKTKLGDISMLKYAGLPQNGENLIVEISEKVKGMPDFKSFSLQLLGRTTGLIPFNASDDVLQTALLETTSSACSSHLLPLPIKVLTIIDYEDDTFSGKASGSIVKEIPAFCGRSSHKNPSYIYNTDETAHLNGKKHIPFSAFLYKTFCFAHRGTMQAIIGLDGLFSYKKGDEEEKEDSLQKFPLDIMMSDEWKYSCVDLVEIIQSKYDDIVSATINAVYFYKSDNDFYVDAWYIGRSSFLPFNIDPMELRVQGVTAENQTISSITVTKNGSLPEYNIAIDTYNCGHNFPLVKVEFCPVSVVSRNRSVQDCSDSSNSLTTYRLQEATNPMSGHFTLTYHSIEGLNETLENIPVSVSEEEFSILLESLEGFGKASVKISGECHQKDYDIQWLSNGGWKELLTLDSVNIVGGDELVATVRKLQNGGILHDPIPGEMLRLPYAEPQVEVIVNGIPSLCQGDCTFSWEADKTPVVYNFTPEIGAENTTIMVNGYNFGDPGSNNITMMVGSIPCETSFHNNSFLRCKLLSGSYGGYNLTVTVTNLGKGSCDNCNQFSVTAGLHRVNPGTAFTSGGVPVIIHGFGFSRDMEVYFGSKKCLKLVPDSTYPANKLRCTIPPTTTGSVDVILKDVGGNVIDTLPSAFEYSNQGLAIISSISPTKVSVLGGQVLTIAGSGFGADQSDIQVLIDDKECDVLSWTTTDVTCDLPSAPPGVHNVDVHVNGKGLADTTINNIAGVTYQLEVSDFNPKHGSVFGSTMLTVQGKGFVDDPSMEVMVGDTPCALDRVTSDQITCHTGSFTQTHLVANTGDHPVYGKGFAWDPSYLQIRAGDSVRWSWKLTTSSDSNLGIHLFTTSSATSMEFNNAGFMSSPHRTIEGEYAYQFNEQGDYYVSSGYVDGEFSGNIVMRMVVHVKPLDPTSYDVTVGLAGYKSVTGSSRSKAVVRTDVQCNTVSKIEGCTDDGTDSSDKFGVGGECYTPIVTNVYPNSGTVNTVISITGKGFASELCANLVKIGNYQCDVTFSNASLIQCMPHPVNTTQAGVAYRVQVIVRNIGEAAIDRATSFALLPSVETIEPDQGSIVGGTIITINGFGFTSGSVNVRIAGTPCTVFDRSYDGMTCITEAFQQETAANISVHLSSTYESVCVGTCLFSAATASTPVISSVSPTTINSTNTSITINGSGFSGNEIVVFVGKQKCRISTISANSIECLLAALPAGEHPVNVTVLPNGMATVSSSTNKKKRSTSVPMLTIHSTSAITMSPLSGSRAGGTKLTFNGNGFEVEGFSVWIDGKPCEVLPGFRNDWFQCATPGRVNRDSATITFIPDPFEPLSFYYDTALTPNVDHVQPETGTAGQILTVYGDKLHGANGTVMVGDAPCSFLGGNSTTIRCLLSDHKGGSYHVSVHVAGLGLSSGDVTFGYNFALSSIQPTRGSYGGGNVLTLEGKNFDESMQVKICENLCIPDPLVSYANRSHFVCTLSPEPIVITKSENALVQHSSTINDLPLSVLTVSQEQVTEGFSKLGQMFSNVTTEGYFETIALPIIKEVTEDAVSIPDNYLFLWKGKNHLGMKVSIWRPEPKTGYACLSDIFNEGYDPPSSDAVVCVHRGLLVQTTTSSSIWHDSQQRVKAWKIAQSPFTIFTNDEFPVGSYSVYRLKENSELSQFDADKLCPVKLSIDGNDVQVNDSFTYTAADTPSVTEVSPTIGGTGGGVSVTITGSHFSNDMSEVKVHLGGVECSVTASSMTSITCLTGSTRESTKSLVDVTIGSKGKAVNIDVSFEYVDLWSSQYTWGGESPPIAGTLVVVNKGQTVVLDQDTPVLKFLLIQGGRLIFARKDVELQAEYILITDGGVLEVGSSEEPFEHKAFITLHGHLRSRELPIYGTKVLGVRNGSLELHGKHVPITWTRLSETALAGSTTVELDLTVTWRVGDEIVIATTGNRHSQNENEVRTISSVSADGMALTLSEALEYSHLSVTQQLPDGTVVETKAEVGLLTRSIVVRGSKHMDWTDAIEACEAGFNTGEFASQTCFQGRFGEEEGSDEFGATLMVHPRYIDSNDAQAHLEYVEFTHVGQAFRLGRYPIHFHIAGDVKGKSYVRGCSINRSFNRAVTIHHSHHVLVEHNVAYDVRGGAMFIEDGIEHGNILRYNLVIFSRQSTSLQNDDITPAAFWVTNPNNTITHNAAAGGTHFGFWYRMHVHPDPPSFDSSICQQRHHVLEFSNNTVHSQGWFGLWIFQTYTPKQDVSCSSTTPQVVTFSSLTTWNCEKGAELVNGGSIRFSRFIMINNQVAGIETKRIIDPHVEWGQAGIFDSVIVAHGDVSKQGQQTKVGVIMPLSKYVLSNVTFINFDRDGSVAIKGTTITGTCTDLCGGFPYRVELLKFYSSPHKVHFRWTHDLVLYDTDGSLTETDSPKVVVADDPSQPSSCIVSAPFSRGLDGAVCPGSMKFHRLAWNNALPTSLVAKNASLESKYGKTVVQFRDKRMTHKPGWVVTLVDGEKYVWSFVNAEQITNISYSAGFYDFLTDDCITIVHELAQTPDIVRIYEGQERNSSSPITSCVGRINGDYYFDVNTKELQYVVSGKDEETEPRSITTAQDDLYVTRNVQLQTYRCFYQDCIPPPDPGSIPPVRERPEDAVLWSKESSWHHAEEGWGGNDGGGQFSPPKNGSKVKIPFGVWMVADVEFPTMTELWIEGVLELDGSKNGNGDYKTFNLEATHIIITGRLIVGWEDRPFQGSVNIHLNGDTKTEEYLPSSDVIVGAKAIGVFGGFDLHGILKETVWCALNSTAKVGDQTITLEKTVDWSKGDEIVISTTSFDPWHTETFKITDVDQTGMVLTLNDSLRFDHLVHRLEYNGRDGASSYVLGAEVGLLTRNIKIIGMDYDKLYEDSFGGRVLVGSYVNASGYPHWGYARIENVEFYHMGQEGFIDDYDPRFALSFLRTGTVSAARPSYVRRCSFHHGFNTAVGVFGAKGLTVDNNVVYHTVGPSIKMEGMDHKLTNNLCLLTRTRSVYQERFEEDIYLWVAAIEVNHAPSVTLQGNVVAGSERAGYRMDGGECGGDGKSNAQRNEARAVLQGIWMNKGDGSSTCTGISNFNIHKAFDYGIYYQGRGSLEISNVLITDAILGVVPIIVGPGSLSHEYVDKYVSITSSTFVAVTKPGDCKTLPFSTDFVSNNVKARAPSLEARKENKESRAAIVWPSFISGWNGSPKKPHGGSLSYPALGGKMVVQNLTFINFDDDTCTDVRHTVFMTNPMVEDFLHPVYSSGLLFINTSKKNLVFYHRPSIGKINPADCVDMECDGMKTALLIDEDGSLLGERGSVVPQAEFEWDGDPRRGLGDYRIPKTLLTALDSSRIPINDIAPNKGILRANTTQTTCTVNPVWRAHECHGYDHEIIIIESLDSDTETRRLSPVALLADDYIDLLNGPQDHGWCSGYTCQHRISTFWAIIALNREYEMHFSGTAPQELRLRVPQIAQHTVMMKIFTTTPRRLDVYVDNIYVPALNAGKDAEGNDILKAPTTPSEYRPTLSSKHGDNFFDRDAQTLYVTISDTSAIDIITAEVVIVTFGIPPVSPNDFFDTGNLVNTLAAFLGIDESRIRIVDIVRVGSKRRKRNTDDGSKVVVEIGEPPAEVKTDPPPTSPVTTLAPGVTRPPNATSTPPVDTRKFEALKNLTSRIVDSLQDGSLSGRLNMSITGLQVVNALPPPGDKEWEVASNTTSDGSTENSQVSFTLPHSLKLHVQLQATYDHVLFPIQPQVEMVDQSGNRVERLGYTTQWSVTAIIKEGPPQAHLNGTVSVAFDGGLATFSDLSLDVASSYEIRFLVTYPTHANKFYIDSGEFSVSSQPDPVGATPKITMVLIIVGGVLGGVLLVALLVGIYKLATNKKKSAKVAISNVDIRGPSRDEKYTRSGESPRLYPDIETKPAVLDSNWLSDKNIQTDGRPDSAASLPPPYHENHQ